MDSLFDPERHRPVLKKTGKRQWNKGAGREEKGSRGRQEDEEDREPVLQGGQAARPMEPGRQPPGADGGPVNNLVTVIPSSTAWGPREVLGSV